MPTLEDIRVADRRHATRNLALEPLSAEALGLDGFTRIPTLAVSARPVSLPAIALPAELRRPGAVQAAVKRAVDVVVSALVLAVTAPLIALVALLINLVLLRGEVPESSRQSAAFSQG